MNIKTTVVYNRIEEGRSLGKSIISAQGGSRSSKTCNIVRWLVMQAISRQSLTIDVVRKSNPVLMTSVFVDFKTFMLEVGWWNESRWHATRQIYTFPTGSTMRFFSADQDQKLRGPGRKILFCNEANELNYFEFNQLDMRTEELIILDYNPSFDDDHWINQVNDEDRTHFFITTYKDNPFLSTRQIDVIESLKDKNTSLYNIYALGQQGIVEGLIYTNWREVDAFPVFVKRQGIGIDFGYTNDPTAVIKCGVIGNDIYAQELLYETHADNARIANHLRKELALRGTADSSDPRTINELNKLGARVDPVVKPLIIPSVNALQQYTLNIVKGSTNLRKELRTYSYEQDKATGKFTNEPVDMNNHGLDAIRYWWAKFVNTQKSGRRVKIDFKHD